MLRAIPDKLMGAAAMAAGMAILFVLPWLDRSPVKSIRYKGNYSKVAIVLFVISFMGLGFLGTQAPTPVYVWLSRIFTVIYFAFFILMPWYSSREKTKPVPDRVVYK